MKVFNKMTLYTATAAVIFVLGVANPIAVSAATSPSLGEAASYAILSTTFTNTSAGTSITGDIGFTIPPATPPLGAHPNYGSAAPYSTAGTDQGSALVDLNNQACTFLGAGAIDLSSTIIGGNPPGTFPPGCYTSGGAMNITAGTVTLSGAGTYIFRPGGALNTAANAVIALSGASACDVFWTPTAATTLGADTTFFGTVIDDAGINVGANTNWTGRALAFGETVTTGDTSNITVPSCSVPSVPGGGQSVGRINVVKNVINDGGGTKTVADFGLFVNGIPVTSGETNAYLSSPTPYVVTETGNAGYTQVFSGDCDSTGRVNLDFIYDRFCIITNNDIGVPVVAPPVPPLIELIKVPSPLALPGGPGEVEYTFTLRNPGTVPVTDITITGDTCSPIVRTSGDTDGDNRLDVSETWIYTCTTTLTETHTNNAVATGWANGISITDIASAIVHVGIPPVVPPLIHVLKVPSPLALVAGGGMVTYTKTVTNPGTVPLSNVRLSDDRCNPVSFISGDADGDALLDPSESWIYSCQVNLTQTTVNTVVASGEANGLTARDIAVATVVVAAAVPTLPDTGVMPGGMTDSLAIVLLLVGALSLVAASLVVSFGKRSS